MLKPPTVQPDRKSSASSSRSFTFRWLFSRSASRSIQSAWFQILKLQLLIEIVTSRTPKAKDFSFHFPPHFVFGLPVGSQLKGRVQGGLQPLQAVNGQSGQKQRTFGRGAQGEGHGQAVPSGELEVVLLETNGGHDFRMARKAGKKLGRKR